MTLAICAIIHVTVQTLYAIHAYYRDREISQFRNQIKIRDDEIRDLKNILIKERANYRLLAEEFAREHDVKITKKKKDRPGPLRTSESGT